MQDNQTERMTKIRMAYEDAMALYKEGLSIESLEEVLELYEEKEIYEACEGIKLAINELKYNNKSGKTKL